MTETEDQHSRTRLKLYYLWLNYFQYQVKMYTGHSHKFSK